MSNEPLLGGDDVPFTGFEFTDDTGSVPNPQLKLRIEGVPALTVLPITMNGNQGSVPLGGIQNVTGVQVSVTGDEGLMTPPDAPTPGIYIGSAQSSRANDPNQTAHTTVSVDAKQYSVPCEQISVKAPAGAATVTITVNGTAQTLNVGPDSMVNWTGNGQSNVTTIDLSTTTGLAYTYTQDPVEGLFMAIQTIAFDWADSNPPTHSDWNLWPLPGPAGIDYPIPPSTS